MAEIAAPDQNKNDGAEIGAGELGNRCVFSAGRLERAEPSTILALPASALLRISAQRSAED